MTLFQRIWPVLLVACFLAGSILLEIKPYNGNITAMFHVDEVVAKQKKLPKDFISLKVPSYDGAQYYQISRNIPKIFQPKKWQEIRSQTSGGYAYQRFLLPFMAYVLALGNEPALPQSFLFINIIAILGTCILVLQGGKNTGLYSIALCLSPAMMVGLHFMLAEPLNIFLITYFLTRYCRQERIDSINVLLLALCVLTREINLVFVLGCMAYSLWKQRWRDVLLLLIPLAIFASLHSLIYLIFKQIPFLRNTENSDWPLHAVVNLLLGKEEGYNMRTLSSLALLLLFVLPTFFLTAYDVLQSKKVNFVSSMLLVFLTLMLIMPSHIWGSITSIGRVITPVYPLYIRYGVEKNSLTHRIITTNILFIGMATTVGLLLSFHPFFTT